MSGKRPLLLLLGIAVVLAGCQRRSYSGPKRYPLSGKVTIDGMPVNWGAIAFLGADQGIDIRPAGAEIIEGVYSVPEENGVNAGKYRVEIRWHKRTGNKYKDRESGEFYDETKEGVPSRFNKDSELLIELPSPDNKYDFELKSLPAK